jgi:hypothetical protein
MQLHLQISDGASARRAASALSSGQRGLPVTLATRPDDEAEES